MSARVNLLPDDVRRRAGAWRSRGLLFGVVGLLIVVLAGATLWQRGQLADARDRLETAQAQQAAAAADVASLAEFGELREREADARAMLTETLGGQVSIAGVLQDLALVLPTDADVNSLNVSLSPREVDDVLVGVGTLGISGETLEGFAPGVERLLLEMDKVAGFRNVFPSSLAIDEQGIAAYRIDAELGVEYLTRRYDDGLFEDLR